MNDSELKERKVLALERLAAGVEGLLIIQQAMAERRLPAADSEIVDIVVDMLVIDKTPLSEVLENAPWIDHDQKVRRQK